jgi:hypothetical protein
MAINYMVLLQGFGGVRAIGIGSVRAHMGKITAGILSST